MEYDLLLVTAGHQLFIKDLLTDSVYVFQRTIALIFKICFKIAVMFVIIILFKTHRNIGTGYYNRWILSYLRLGLKYNSTDSCMIHIFS